jgi:uracil-DNA glycosylase
MGLPFQGEAGALLDKMLAAIGLNRELIYLTTLVKCVPATPEISAKSGVIPAPDPQQVRACLPILQQQIAALKPKLICTMDPLPAQVLLRSQRSLLQLRGRFHDYQGIPLIATLAPEYLRHNPEMKKAAWEDLQLIRTRLARS